jgi:radical SAM protein with 4Fe4S-binding SPASM domain
MSMNAHDSNYFVFHPHVQLVRGRVGAAVHDLFAGQIYWFREAPVAEALSRLALGDSALSAAAAANLAPQDLDRYLTVLSQLDLGRIVEHRAAAELYRPILLRSQADDNAVYRDGGALTVEITGACLYNCPWCTSRTAFTPTACACGVWRDQAAPLPIAELLSAVEHLSYVGVQLLVVRGGEPLLEAERLWELVAAACRLGMRCEIHSTGTLIDKEAVSRLRGLPVQMVLPIVAREPARFDRAVGLAGSWTALQSGLAALQSAGIPFSAKVPAHLECLEEAEATAAWATELGATQISFVSYLTSVNAAPLDLRKWLGPGSPQNMAVTLQQFLTNGQSQFCLDRSYFIAGDGRVTPCIAQRRPLADLVQADMATILRENRLSPLDKTARHQMPECRACEFRMGCRACLVRTEQLTGAATGRHWSCRYNPETATWE